MKSKRFFVAFFVALLLAVASGTAWAGEITSASINPSTITVDQGATLNNAFNVVISGISGNVTAGSQNPDLSYCAYLLLEVDSNNDVVLTCVTGGTFAIPQGNYNKTPLPGTLPFTLPVNVTVNSDVPCATYTRSVTISVPNGAGVDFGGGVKTQTFSLTIIVECGPVTPEGCSHGYWKAPQHSDSWPSPYEPTTTIGSVFSAALGGDFENTTFIAALALTGGPGVSGATQILLREAVAAILNAVHPDVNYLFSVASVEDQVDDAINSNDRDTILAAKDVLEAENAGTDLDPRFCPLN